MHLSFLLIISFFPVCEVKRDKKGKKKHNDYSITSPTEVPSLIMPRQSEAGNNEGGNKKDDKGQEVLDPQPGFFVDDLRPRRDPMWAHLEEVRTLQQMGIMCFMVMLILY